MGKNVLVHFDPVGTPPNYQNGTDNLLVFNTSDLIFKSIAYADVDADNTFYFIDDLDTEVAIAPTSKETPIPNDAGLEFHTYCDGTTLNTLEIAPSGTLDKWNSATTYDIANDPVYVVHRGVLYRLIKNGTSTNEEPALGFIISTTQIWYPVTRITPDLIGDNWDSTNTYNQGADDITYFNQSGWRLLVASDLGTEPGTAPLTWQKLNDPDIKDDTLVETASANDILCGGTYYSINILSIAQTPNPPLQSYQLVIIISIAVLISIGN